MPVGALETSKEVREQRDVRILIHHEFRQGHWVAKAWGASTTRERTTIRLFDKLRKGDMEIDPKPRAGCPVRCDKDPLLQKVGALSTRQWYSNTTANLPKFGSNGHGEKA
ncbi:hypothetical protein TNCV_1558751 [Trichonephila clavipes]|nr:hypothetical protein TNCV_1558751 [Trichonephila clavipes]